MTEIQSPPYSVQVEPVEGCPLRCPFCGINGIRGNERDYKYMTLDTAATIAAQIACFKWTSRIEFAMHGEPTLHPDLVKIIEIFRSHLPDNYFLLTTNGYGLRPKTKQKIMELLDAGIDCLAIDRYEGVTWSAAIMKRLGNTPYLKYPEDSAGNPHTRSKKKRIVFLAPINITSEGTHGKKIFGNHCGAGAELDFSAKEKRCARPFRELSFRWDGNVALCCNDWRGLYRIGNIHDMPLEDLWQHPHFRAARRKLYHKQRDFGPCNGCNHLSFRVGFLPDKQGKETLPLPNTNDKKIIRKALSGEPMAKPVWREWERINA